MRLLWSQGAEFSFRPGEFFGREEELTSLLRVCLEGKSGIGASVLLYGPPNIGKSSLLLKLKSELKLLPESAAPPSPFAFYYSFSNILSHPLALSQHFLQEYLWQLLVFLGESPPAAFDLDALCESLTARGHTECRDFLSAHRRYSEKGDGLSALANAFSFPFATGGDLLYPVFLFDDFQYTIKLQNIPEGAIFSILRPYIKSGHFPMIVSGSSPGHVTSSLKREGLFGSFQLLEVGGLSPDASVRAWAPLFERRKIRMPEHLMARAAARLGHVPIYQRMFAEEVSFRNDQIEDEVAFENLFAFSITEGKLNRYWREFFENAIPDRVNRARAIKFLKRVMFDQFPIDTFEGAFSLLGTSPEEGGEILSALEERFPGTPPIRSEEMGELGTLAQVVAFLAAGVPSPPSVPAERASAATTPERDRAEIERALLAVVADKTGYPTDMLDLEMGLDADLGIDSIKRVEILSALEERLPGLPSIRSEEMGELRTLDQVVEFLARSAPDPEPTCWSRSTASIRPSRAFSRWVLPMDFICSYSLWLSL